MNRFFSENIVISLPAFFASFVPALALFLLLLWLAAIEKRKSRILTNSCFKCFTLFQGVEAHCLCYSSVSVLDSCTKHWLLYFWRRGRWLYWWFFLYWWWWWWWLSFDLYSHLYVNVYVCIDGVLCLVLSVCCVLVLHIPELEDP